MAAAAVGVGVVGFYWIGKRTAKATGELATRAAVATGRGLDPTSQGNIFNRGFNALWQAISGDESTLGTKVFDWLHDDQAKVDAAASRPGTGLY